MPSLADLRQRLTDLSPKTGRVREETMTFWTTPWAWRDLDGVYVGHDGSVWLYRELTLAPLEWEDGDVRLATGRPLAELLSELGASSRDYGKGIKTLSSNREIHLLSIIWEDMAQPSDNITDELRSFQEAALTFTAPRKTLVIGVRLRSALASTESSKTLLDQVKDGVTHGIGEAVPNLDNYAKDRQTITKLLSRHDARPPRREVLSQMESWFNLGQGPDPVLYETKDCVYHDESGDRIEFAAVRQFNNPVMHAPDAQWLLDAATHRAGAEVVSIRAELQPATVARSRLRRSQRRVREQMEEEAATGDIDRPENSETFNLASEVESYYTGGREPLLSNCSIITAHRATDDTDETYIDLLRADYNIDVTPLALRQLAALSETLPCSPIRVNPHLQDVSVPMIAYAGLQGFSSLGDSSGLHVGVINPDGVPCKLEPFAAAASNAPPSMAILGDSGSGKSYLMQLLATQATLNGINTVFINPKGFETLSPFAELVDGTVVNLSKLEEEGGYFDPFRFTEPEMAAEIATAHILEVLGNTSGHAGGGFTAQQEIGLGDGLKRGALDGARCVTDALRYVNDPEVRAQVEAQMNASTLFALGIGKTPTRPLDARQGLTLIEFDRPLGLPGPGKDPRAYTRAERIAVATLQLITRASLEMLAKSGDGGALFLDEAHHFLGSDQGLEHLRLLAREGRSRNLWPVFATQQVSDIIAQGVDLEGYLSRVFAMQLSDAKEAAAALELCGLEATRARIDWLSDVRAQPQEDGTVRPAQALHRDLRNRHAALMIGPVPPAAHQAFTTNPEERRKREQAEGQ